MCDAYTNAVLVFRRTRDSLFLKRTEGPSFHGPANKEVVS